MSASTSPDEADAFRIDLRAIAQKIREKWGDESFDRTPWIRDMLKEVHITQSFLYLVENVDSQLSRNFRYHYYSRASLRSFLFVFLLREPCSLS